jgi:3-hydroxyisobutyrate dehydrogenase-like beta-hydroxyacid dehydrogenase
MSDQKIGILGLGIIGAIWSRHYHDAGVLAGTWNRSPKPDTPLWQDDALSVARSANLIQIVVADPAAVQGVLDQIKPALDATKTVIQSSTIDPDSGEGFQQQVEATGARYLECPFTGSKPAAEARKTVFYQGGAPEHLAAVEPILSIISAVRIRIGTPRQACALKLAMNLNISTQMQGLCEVLTVCRRAGISDEVFGTALEGNMSYSPLMGLKWPQVRDENYDPLFSVKHMAKDMRLAAGMPGVDDLEVLKIVRTRLAAAEDAGLGDEDFAAIYKLID